MVLSKWLVEDAQVVVDDEPTSHQVMHVIHFRKRQGLTNISSKPLAQGTIPTFHVIDLTTALSDTAVSFFRKYFLVSLPEVTEAVTMAILLWDTFPEFVTGLCTPVANGEGDNLPSSATHHRPEPTFILPKAYKWPEFIEFKNVIFLCWDQSLLQVGLCLDFFWASVTVCCGKSHIVLRYLSCWVFLDKLPECVLFAHRYSYFLDWVHLICDTLCRGIADFRSGSCRSSLDWHSRTVDMCRFFLQLSCPHFTRYHLCETTTLSFLWNVLKSSHVETRAELGTAIVMAVRFTLVSQSSNCKHGHARPTQHTQFPRNHHLAESIW